MNVRQTRPANEDFACVLSANVSDVKQTQLDEQREQAERARINRKQKIYESYANDQLARIVQSLMKTEKKKRTKSSGKNSSEEGKKKTQERTQSCQIVDIGGGELVEQLVTDEESNNSGDSSECLDEVDKLPWEYSEEVMMEDQRKLSDALSSERKKLATNFGQSVSEVKIKKPKVDNSLICPSINQVGLLKTQTQLIGRNEALHEDDDQGSM